MPLSWLVPPTPLSITVRYSYDQCMKLLKCTYIVPHPGYAESKSDGAVGQFAKRNNEDKKNSSSNPTPGKLPYPKNEDKIEQKKLEEATVAQVKALPGYAQLLGNQSVDDILCETCVLSFSMVLIMLLS